MTVSKEAYEQALMKCIAACAKWRAQNPDARLKFQPWSWMPKDAKKLSPDGKSVAIIAGLDVAIESGAAGNSITRKLLLAIDRGTPNGGASVLMAECAIEEVYGIKKALTEKPADPFFTELKQVCPECKTALDCVSGLRHDYKPKPGAITLCVSCAAILKFDAAMQLQLTTLEERSTLPPEVFEAAKYIAMHKAGKID